MLFSMSFTVKPGAAERSLRVSGPLRTGRAGRAAALRAGPFRRAVAALQGELARTIGHIAAVHSARVHLVIPEKALFREQQEKTTASVALTLVPGRHLASEQIRGITQLMASSVPGLEPQDVVIVDDTGQILRKDERTNTLAQPEAQLAHQRAQESDLERKVQTLLEPAVGKGKVQARVSVTLDFQQLERTEERYDADNPAIRSQQRVKEEGTGTGFWAVGTPVGTPYPGYGG